MDFLFGSKVAASMDVGHHSVKWAAVDKKKGVCHVWQAPLFPERQTRKDLLDEAVLCQRLAGLIAECKKAMPVWSKSVVSPAYGNKVFYGYVEFGLTKPKFLKYAVTSALLNTLPYPLEELELDLTQVEPLSQRDDRSAAFYGMIHLSHHERLKARAEACGLKLEGMSLVPTALARVWGRNRSNESPPLVALVHVGFEKTLVVVARGEQPYYVREIAIAGAQFTYCFQVEQGLTWEQAESNKVHYDVFTGREHFIEPDLRKWLDEVQRSVEHFETKYKDKQHKVSQLVLSGGGACWKGLAQRLEDHLRLPVVVDGWSQIHPLEPRSEDEALIHKVSIGSSLR